ncbi:MAG: hypothetical protein WDM81_20355 [Rhizomicrobium sp.]
MPNQQKHQRETASRRGRTGQGDGRIAQAAGDRRSARAAPTALPR